MIYIFLTFNSFPSISKAICELFRYVDFLPPPSGPHFLEENMEIYVFRSSESINSPMVLDYSRNRCGTANLGILFIFKQYGDDF